jgi:peptidoglycan/LPS O-acetylase OafA/YrhL
MKSYFLDIFQKDKKDIISFHALRSYLLIMVMISHLCNNYKLISNNVIIQILSSLYFSIDILFLLSGFFITLPLLENKINRVFLINFYTKRFIRIVPTYYIAILFYWYLNFTELQKITKIYPIIKNQEVELLYNKLILSINYVWGDFLFISNYLPSRMVNVGWCISAIVHFYLLIPFLVEFSKRYFKNHRIIFWIFLYLLVLFFRFYHYYNNILIEKIYFMTHTRLDSFIAGIILAEYYLYFQKNSYKFSFSSNIRNMISIFLLVNLFFILFGTYWKYPLMQFVFNYNWYNIIAFLL